MKDMDQSPSTERYWYARWRKEHTTSEWLRREIDRLRNHIDYLEERMTKTPDKV